MDYKLVQVIKDIFVHLLIYGCVKLAVEGNYFGQSALKEVKHNFWNFLP